MNEWAGEGILSLMCSPLSTTPTPKSSQVFPSPACHPPTISWSRAPMMPSASGQGQWFISTSENCQGIFLHPTLRALGDSISLTGLEVRARSRVSRVAFLSKDSAGLPHTIPWLPSHHKTSQQKV